MNRLEWEGVRTVRALVKKSPYELLDWPGIGFVSLWEIRDALQSRGLSLRDDPGRHAIWDWYQARKADKHQKGLNQDG